MAASEGELGLLHAAVARYLSEKIASGEATASDVTNALKMLKDNNITCDADAGGVLDRLKDQLEGRRVAPAANADLADALENLEFHSQQVN